SKSIPVPKSHILNIDFEGKGFIYQRRPFWCHLYRSCVKGKIRTIEMVSPDSGITGEYKNGLQVFLKSTQTGKRFLYDITQGLSVLIRANFGVKITRQTLKIGQVLRSSRAQKKDGTHTGCQHKFFCQIFTR